MAELSYTKLEMQSYFSDNQLPTRLKQLAFRWRTKMIKVGWNYGNKLKCPICQIGDDTQNHLFQCQELNNESHSRSSKHDFDSDSDSDNNNNNNNNKNINEPNNNNINLPKHMLMRLETVLRKREVIIEQREKSQKQN